MLDILNETWWLRKVETIKKNSPPLHFSFLILSSIFILIYLCQMCTTPAFTYSLLSPWGEGEKIKWSYDWLAIWCRNEKKVNRIVKEIYSYHLEMQTVTRVLVI